MSVHTHDTMTINAKTKTLWPIIGAIGFVIMLSIAFAGDRRPLPDICDTDYVNALYVAGHMVDNGAGHDIYPDLKARNFYGEKFAVYTRTLLNKPGETRLYLFTYPPAVALATAPLSWLAPRESLMAWQLISLASLFLSALALASVKGTRSSVWRIFLGAGLFFPVLDVIVVGQTSILLGLLPLSLGYFFWQRRNYLVTGICWSVLGLKPQIALPVAIICATLLLAWLQKRVDKRQAISIVGGVLLGTFVLHLVPCLLLGMDSFILWVNAVRMSGQAFASEETGYWQYHLFCSLPCLAVLALPKELWLQARMPAYVLGLLALLASLPFCARLLSLRTGAETQRDLLMILSTPFIIISAPHLLIYDTCLLLLPAWILFYRLPEGSRFVRIGQMGALVFMFALDIYLMVILTQPGLPALVWQIISLSAFSIYILLLFTTSKTVAEAA